MHNIIPSGTRGYKDRYPATRLPTTMSTLKILRKSARVFRAPSRKEMRFPTSFAAPRGVAVTKRTTVGLIRRLDRFTPHALHVCIVMLNLYSLTTTWTRAMVFFLFAFRQ